jgi:hypothetical protein
MSAEETPSPRFYELNSYQWNLHRVAKTVRIGGKTIPHPGRECAIFVVHGMGKQEWTDTAVMLRSGFEDALVKILKWQLKHPPEHKISEKDKTPPPFIHEGFWANYADIEIFFPEDWSRFNDHEQGFFRNLWMKRTFAAFRTFWWLLSQPVRLLYLPRATFIARLVYIPLQFLFPAALILALIRWRKVLANILSDVRLYAYPQGMSEKAIVQRIDLRVVTGFLELIGLDIDFRPLKKKDKLHVMGEPFEFKRIVWVAHSLGTVISYNVLSDLFHRAAEIKKSGSRIQKAGVEKFRKSLHRFVTMGSPLDKFACLFPDALRPWPYKNRSELLDDTGDTLKLRSGGERKEWWINFYDVLDPVSGALDNPIICGNTSPLNIHSRFKSLALIPGMAHSSYWNDMKVLRFILGRTYGKEYLYDRPVKLTFSMRQSFYAAIGSVMWVVILYGIPILLIIYYKEIADVIWNFAKSYLGALLIT